MDGNSVKNRKLKGDKSDEKKKVNLEGDLKKLKENKKAKDYTKRKKKNFILHSLFLKIYNSDLNHEDFIDSQTGQLRKVEYITEKTVDRVYTCGSYVSLLADEALEKKKLVFGIFCNNRFCPICEKMKSYNDFIALSTITKYLYEEKNRSFSFITLTIPNVEGFELSEQILKLNVAVNRFLKYKQVNKAFKGVIKRLEVTYNYKRNDFHPYIHLLVSVNKSYFRSRFYIKHAYILNLWRRVTSNEKITQIDVKKLENKSKNELSESLLRISKHMSNISNFDPKLYNLNNWEQFFYYVRGLKNKKFFSFSGEFKEAVKKFKDGELDKYLNQEVVDYIYLLKYNFDFYFTKKYNVDLTKITDEERKKYLQFMFNDIKKDFGNDLD